MVAWVGPILGMSLMDQQDMSAGPALLFLMDMSHAWLNTELGLDGANDPLQCHQAKTPYLLRS